MRGHPWYRLHVSTFVVLAVPVAVFILGMPGHYVGGGGGGSLHVTIQEHDGGGRSMSQCGGQN